MQFNYDPLRDGNSILTLLDYMGGDLRVVNAAKASYNKVATEMDERATKLMSTLLSGIDEPQHTAPLRHVVFTFKVKTPIVVARQWWKHVVASSYTEEQSGWNETSFRYTGADEQDYYIPNELRTQHKTNKQASATPLSYEDSRYMLMAYENQCDDAAKLYRQMIEAGVAREQARFVLPPAFYTTFMWTVSLQSLLNFIDLREGHGAQWEIVQYANCLKDVVSCVCPVAFRTWEYRKEVLRDAMELYRNS